MTLLPLWMKFPKYAPHPDSLLQFSTVLNSVCFILPSLYGGWRSPVVPPVGSASWHTWLCAVSSPKRSKLLGLWLVLVNCGAAYSGSKVDKVRQTSLCTLGKLEPPSNKSPYPVALLNHYSLGIVSYVATDTSVGTEFHFLMFCLEVRDLYSLFLLYLSMELTVTHRVHCK